MSEASRLALWAKQNGHSYGVVYNRLVNGWSYERATTEPVRPRGKFDKALLAAQKKRAERRRKTAELMKDAGWSQKVLDRIEAKHVAKKPKATRKGRHWAVEDTSPEHIRVLRAKLCNDFIKTGNLDPDITAQLRNYADACKAIDRHPVELPAQSSTENYVRGRDDSRDDEHGGGAEAHVFGPE